MNNFLFVYGSLMRPFESSMRQFLEEKSRFRGEGRVNGILYDLGRYPGLVLDEVKGRLITGHVFELKRPEEVFRVLDKYEGIDPKRPAAGEYRREKEMVHLEGEAVSCWMYLYNLPTNNLTEIPGNSYIGYARNNPDHQRFIASA